MPRDTALAAIPGGRLRRDAAGAWSAMNAESERRRGVTLRPLGPLSSYRTLTQQRQLRREWNVAFAASRKVPAGERMRFAVAAYDRGAGNAIHALAGGDIDANTAHRDYSADVLERRDVVARYLKRHALPA
jgi:hypothetical protein